MSAAPKRQARISATRGQARQVPADVAQLVDRAATLLQPPQASAQSVDPLIELIQNVRACLVVMRAALPGEFKRLSEAEASGHQVATLALHESLDEAEDLANLGGLRVDGAKRVQDLLMYARNLMACLETALWHVCAGREDSEDEASLTAGDVAGTCALIEEYLVEVVVALGGPAPGAKGGAA